MHSQQRVSESEPTKPISASALLFAAIALEACGNNQIEWKEEVKLKSRDDVVMQRTARSKPFGEVSGPAGGENEGCVTIRSEKQAVLSWLLQQPQFSQVFGFQRRTNDAGLRQ